MSAAVTSVVAARTPESVLVEAGVEAEVVELSEVEVELDDSDGSLASSEELQDARDATIEAAISMARSLRDFIGFTSYFLVYLQAEETPRPWVRIVRL